MGSRYQNMCLIPPRSNATFLATWVMDFVMMTPIMKSVTLIKEIVAMPKLTDLYVLNAFALLLPILVLTVKNGIHAGKNQDIRGMEFVMILSILSNATLMVAIVAQIKTSTYVRIAFVSPQI